MLKTPFLLFNRTIWDCDHCKNFVISVGHSYVGRSESIVEYLKGVTFCESPILDLDAEGVAGCQKSIEWFMPRALYVVDYDLHHSAHHMCRDWFHGICEGHPPHPYEEFTTTNLF